MCECVCSVGVGLYRLGWDVRNVLVVVKTSRFMAEQHIHGREHKIPTTFR